MAFGYQWTADGFGVRLTEIAGNGVTIPLAEREWARVSLFGQSEDQQLGDPVGIHDPLFTPNIYGFPDASGFDVGFRAALGQHYEVRLTGVVDQVHERLLITPSLVMGPVHSPTRAFHTASLGYRIPAASLGDIADLRVITLDHRYRTWSSITTGDVGRWSHPGLQRRGGTEMGSAFNPLGLFEYDQPSEDARADLAGWKAITYVYNRVTNHGILFRSLDNAGRGKIHQVQRDGVTGDLLFRAIGIPQANVNGINGTSDGALPTLEMRPMIGRPDDVAIYVREREIEEEHPAFSKGFIQTRTDAAATPFLKRGVAHMVLNTSDYAAVVDWDRHATDVERTIAWAKLGKNRLLAHPYNFHLGNVGQYQPTTAPWREGAADAIRRMSAAGADVILYAFPGRPVEIDGEGRGLPADALIRAQRAMTRAEWPDGSIPIVRGSGTDDSLGWEFPFAGNIAANAEYDTITLDAVEAGMEDVHEHVVGYYRDVESALVQDDDPAKDPADRGVGSATVIPARRAAIDGYRHAITARTGKPAIVASEYPTDVLGPGVFDVVGASTDVGTGGLLTNIIPFAAYLYSDVVRLTHWHPVAAAPGATSLYHGVKIGEVEYVSDREGRMAQHCHYWHSGMLCPLEVRQDVAPSYFPEEGEDGFDTFALAAPWREMMARLWLRHPDIAALWLTSRRVRDLAAGHDDVMHEAAATGDLVPVLADSFRLFSSVRYSDPRDWLMVGLTNWSHDYPRTVTLSETLTTTTHPMLGDEPRIVDLIDLETGDRSRLGLYDGGGTLELDVDVGPGDAYIVVAQPVSPTQTWQAKPRAATTWGAVA